jgi:hypothetical protein
MNIVHKKKQPVLGQCWVCGKSATFDYDGILLCEEHHQIRLSGKIFVKELKDTYLPVAPLKAPTLTSCTGKMAIVPAEEAARHFRIHDIDKMVIIYVQGQYFMSMINEMYQ